MTRPERVEPDKSPTTAQLKAEIDSGKTGDKVAWPDPAAAPLGTDDEAAGTPPSPQRIALARRQERRAARYEYPNRGWTTGAIFGAVIVAVALLIWLFGLASF